MLLNTYAYIDFKLQKFSFWSFSSEKENIRDISFKGLTLDFNYQLSFNWIHYNHTGKVKYGLAILSKLDIWFKNTHSIKKGSRKPSLI